MFHSVGTQRQRTRQQVAICKAPAVLRTLFKNLVRARPFATAQANGRLSTRHNKRAPTASELRTRCFRLHSQARPSRRRMLSGELTGRLKTTRQGPGCMKSAGTSLKYRTRSQGTLTCWGPCNSAIRSREQSSVVGSASVEGSSGPKACRRAAEAATARYLQVSCSAPIAATVRIEARRWQIPRPKGEASLATTQGCQSPRKLLLKRGMRDAIKRSSFCTPVQRRAEPARWACAKP